MISPDAISTLNRLHFLMLRSFAAYSVTVRPVTFRGPEEMRDLLAKIAEEQQSLARQIAASIHEQHADIESGQYPIEFTSWNDVALPRILERTIELLKKVIEEAETIAARDSGAPVFHFAKEVQNLTQQQVDLLENALGVKADTV